VSEVEQLKENDTTRQDLNILPNSTYKDTICLEYSILSNFKSAETDP